MYDQLGGGFHRYSTDERWLVPHFEKMLYDNALLIRLYVHAWQVTGPTTTAGSRPRRATTCSASSATPRAASSPPRTPTARAWRAGSSSGRGTSSWTSPGEPVATALGATPERELGGHERPVAPDAARGGRRPSSSSTRASSSATSRSRGPSCSTSASGGSAPRPTTRSSRPGTGWRSPRSPRLAGPSTSPTYVEAAVRAAEFVSTHLRDGSGRLLRSWRDGRAGRPAFADDHALMAEAAPRPVRDDVRAPLVRAREDARGRPDPPVPRRGTRRLLPDGHRRRDASSSARRSSSDNAVPSGNSVAADVLQRLAHLTGEARYEKAGGRRAATGPRRDGRGADRVRTRARRPRPLPVDRQGGGDRRRPGLAGDAAPSRPRSPRSGSCRTTCSPCPRPTTPPRATPSRSSGTGRSGRPTPPRSSASASTASSRSPTRPPSWRS